MNNLTLAKLFAYSNIDARLSSSDLRGPYQLVTKLISQFNFLATTRPLQKIKPLPQTPAVFYNLPNTRVVNLYIDPKNRELSFKSILLVRPNKPFQHLHTI